MSRSVLNFWLDLFLLINFLVLSWIATLVRFVFPPGVESRGWKLWGLTYDQWSSLEFAALSVLAGGIVLHLMLHWSWICGTLVHLFSKKGKIDDGMQTIYGVTALIIIFHILGLGVAAGALSIQGPP